jgi:hypothetical protein
MRQMEASRVDAMRIDYFDFVRADRMAMTMTASDADGLCAKNE